MAIKKIGAHPLVVAVAFGLLGPEMLDSLPSSEESLVGWGSSEDLESREATSVDAEEFARVERAWLEARDLTVG